MNEELYIITEDYFDEFSDILNPDYGTGTIVTQDEDGTIHKQESLALRGDPINPPPKRPPILP